MRSKWIFVIALLISSDVLAEQTIINNYGTNSPSSAPNPSTAQNCQGNQNDSNGNQPEGTFSYNTNTTSGTIVTTGSKKPNIPNNNCNNVSPIIQPFVYAQPPVPGPGPR